MISILKWGWSSAVWFDRQFDMRRNRFKDYLSLVKDYGIQIIKRIKRSWNLEENRDLKVLLTYSLKLSHARLLSETETRLVPLAYLGNNKNSKEVAELNKQLAKAEKRIEYDWNPLFR